MTEKKTEQVSKEAKLQRLKKRSKSSLKTMQKTRERHPVRTKSRIVKYGAKGFGRNIWLSSAATIVMAVTLIILFVTVVASVILTSTAEMMKNKIDVTIYLRPNTSQEVLDELTEIIKTDANVKSVETSDSAQEYAKFLAENKESDEILSIMDEEMTELMIGKMQATMRIKVYDVEKLDSVKNLVTTNELFQQYIDPDMLPTYDVNQTEIATITSWANIARTGGIVLAAVFLLISILIIFSTIRMAIFSRREEIYMMNLVGADKKFIRGPFLIEAEICGIIAGIVGGVVSYFGFQMLAPKLEGYGIDVSAISDVLNSNQLILVFLVFIVVGMLIGRISARMAVSKYIHRAA